MSQPPQPCTGQQDPHILPVATARKQFPQRMQDARERGVPLAGAGGGPVADEVLERLRHADSLGGAAGRLHLADVVVELALGDAVEVHGVAHDAVADLLVPLQQRGDVVELFAVPHLALEQLRAGCLTVSAIGLGGKLRDFPSSVGGTNRSLLLGGVDVQGLQPVELRLLRLGVRREAAEGLEEPAARVVVVPFAVLPVHALEQPLFLLEMPLRVRLARQAAIFGDDKVELADLKDDLRGLSVMRTVNSSGLGGYETTEVGSCLSVSESRTSML